MKKAGLVFAALLAGCITVQTPPPARCPPCQEEAPTLEPKEPAPKLPKRPDIQQANEVRR